MAVPTKAIAPPTSRLPLNPWATVKAPKVSVLIMFSSSSLSILGPTLGAGDGFMKLIIFNITID